MGNIAIKKGDTIRLADTPLKTIDCIIKGSVTVQGAYEESTLTTGDVIGIIDIENNVHSNTYIAKEDCFLVSYDFTDSTKVKELLSENATIAKCMLTSVIKQLCGLLDSYVFKQFECKNLYTFLNESYAEYKQLCESFGVPAKPLLGLSEVEEIQMDSDIETWMISYYDDFKDLISGNLNDMFITHPSFTIGLITKASKDYIALKKCMNQTYDYMSALSTLLLNENQLDFFDLYTSLYYKTLRNGSENTSLSATISTFIIHIQSTSSINKDLARERMDAYKEELANIMEELENGSPQSNFVSSSKANLKDSVDTILGYSGVSDETADTFKKLLIKYKKYIDKNATDSAIMKLRSELTSLFYEIYTASFMKSLDDKNIPTILNMFFKFGYIDEELAGLENAAYLLSIADSYRGNPMLSVYTIYEWLIEIYKGRKEPRRNEFDVDYHGYVHELLVSKKITKQQEQALLQNTKQKLTFELANLFPITNKMTFGRLTTFCPLFSEHNVLKSLEDALVTPDKLCGAIERIKDIDFSAFYREELYFNTEASIAKEMIQSEILPDIILMPNIGTRGVMWQEIEGKRRQSPATYVLPVFMLENLDLIIIRLTGEYRFEMCKRTQGARWNDIADPSLTSEYCDYIQFYRKNNELSTDAKEKIKSALAKARNSFKEMFVQDYIVWIMYEGKGAPRLNKIARRILFTYCPFPLDVRTELVANPLYREVIERWTIKRRQEQHRLNNVFIKLNNIGKPIPDELLNQQKFLEM